MFLVLYPFLALFSVLFAALTWILAPWLGRQVDAEGNLPGWLRVFQTFDASCFEGRKPPYNYTGSPAEVAAQWLRRNPGYTMDWLLGCAFDPAQWTVTRDDEQPGRVTFIAWGPRGRFNLYLQRGTLYLKLGWKAWNNWEGGHWNPAPANGWNRIPICCTIARRQAKAPA
jgi:hypothetical protein